MCSTGWSGSPSTTAPAALRVARIWSETNFTVASDGAAFDPVLFELRRFDRDDFGLLLLVRALARGDRVGEAAEHVGAQERLKLGAITRGKGLNDDLEGAARAGKKGGAIEVRCLTPATGRPRRRQRGRRR